MAAYKTPQDVQTLAKKFYHAPLTRRGKQISRTLLQLANLHVENVDVLIARAQVARDQAAAIRERMDLHQNQAATAAPQEPAASRLGRIRQAFGRTMRRMGSAFVNLFANLSHAVANAFRARRANRLDGIADGFDALAQNPEAPRQQLETRLEQLCREYLDDYYRTDIYQRYEKATPVQRHDLIERGLENVYASMNMLNDNRLLNHHNAPRFNGPFFSACGWGVASLSAAGIFGASAIKAAQLTFGIWKALELNAIPAIGASLTPAAPVAAAIIAMPVMAYFIWRTKESVKSYAQQRNAWIVRPLREAAERTLNEVVPLSVNITRDNDTMVSISHDGRVDFFQRSNPVQPPPVGHDPNLN